MDHDGYRNYFFNSTTIIAVVRDSAESSDAGLPKSLEEALGDRDLEEAIGGCYYV